jgi:hypothetical protein
MVQLCHTMQQHSYPLIFHSLCASSFPVPLELVSALLLVPCKSKTAALANGKVEQSPKPMVEEA